MKKKFSLNDKFHCKEKSEVVKLKKGRFEKIFYPFFYFLLLISFVVSANYSFDRVYYENIYISGPSMLPTLLGGTIKEDVGKEGDKTSVYYSYYGQADKDPKVLNNLKRFDVVISHYPVSWSNTNDYVVKRVWGFPGETIRLTHDAEKYTFSVSVNNNIVYSIDGQINKGQDILIKPLTKPQHYNLVTFKLPNKTFNVNISNNANRQIGNATTGYVLKDDEYFIMGDNWYASSDCYTHMKPDISQRIDYVSLKCIQGKVVKIDGYGEISGSDFKTKIQFEKGMFDF